MTSHRTVGSITLGVLGLVFLTGSSLFGQVHQSKADTGRMAWGHKDYSRHTGAHYCDRVIAEVLADQSRGYRPDTSAASPNVPLDDTLPQPVVAAARACGEQFTVEGTDPRHLLGLARIFLVLGKDDRAKAAIERTVALQSTPEARAYMMFTAIVSLLGAVPARLPLAGEYVKQLETMEAAGKVPAARAHLLFASYWHDQYTPDSIRAHANQAIAIWKTMTKQEQNNTGINWIYKHLIDVANDEGNLVLIEKILAQAAADGVSEWQNGSGDEWIVGNIRMLDRRKAVYGKQTRPLDATFWFNHQGVPQPSPGHVSLVIRVENGVCGWECHKLYEIIQSLHAKHGTDLVVTFATETNGWLPGSGPLTPLEEANGIARHYLTFLRLPVVVMVDELPVDTLSDGRLVRGPSRLSDIFPGGGATNALLVDRDGKIQWLGSLRWDQADRRMLDFAIGRALRGPVRQNAATATVGTQQ